MVFLNTCVLTSEHHNQPPWLDEFQGENPHHPNSSSVTPNLFLISSSFYPQTVTGLFYLKIFLYSIQKAYLRYDVHFKALSGTL